MNCTSSGVYVYVCDIKVLKFKEFKIIHNNLLLCLQNPVYYYSDFCHSCVNSTYLYLTYKERPI